MPRAYKHGNGRIQFRGSGGRFRDATLRDFGITNENKNLDTYICNVCGREFIPVLLSGVCCGVDNKTLKPPDPIPDDELEILNQIDEIKNKPFISRFDLEDINRLEWNLRKLKKSKNP